MGQRCIGVYYRDGVLQAGSAGKSGFERCQAAHGVIELGYVETGCVLRALAPSRAYRICENDFCELEFGQHSSLH